MNLEVMRGILIPFVGTSLGAGCVFFLWGKLPRTPERARCSAWSSRS